MPVEIRFGSNAKKENVTNFSMKVLEDILQAAGLNTALISSTARTPADQARVMFNNIETHGVAAQKKLYAAAGDMVIDEYVRAKRAGKTPIEIKAAMEAKIIEIGPTRISHHAADPNVLCVFDVAPSSITRKAEFERAVKADRRVKKFLMPPVDPGYHLEIPQPAIPQPAAEVSPEGATRGVIGRGVARKAASRKMASRKATGKAAGRKAGKGGRKARKA
ncbi:MAG TPA: hypothetical protein VGV38_19590 [Pyrinomonadaceae bacterium]|nr:hypothetical protein [Pyrinomonadaceae bacterium]